MAKIKGIRRPEELPLRASDFQFSIKRLLLVMTAFAMILAMGYPAGLGLPVGAVLLVVTLVILWNDWSAVHLTRAHLMVRAGNLKEALANYNKAIQAAPGRADRYCYRAAVHFRQGDLQAAERDYSEAIRAEPRFVPAWVSRSNVRNLAGRFQEAIDDATIALCLAPGDYGALCTRGLNSACLGEFEMALGDLEEAIRANPDRPDGYRLRGLVCLWAKRCAAAVDDFLLAQRIDPQEEDVVIPLARARFGLGEYRAATDLLEGYLRESPESPEALGALALFLATCPEDRFRNGRRSLQLAEKAMALNAADGGTLLSALAAAYAELGRFEQAVAYGRQALEQSMPCHRPEREARLAAYQECRPYRDWPRPEGDSSPIPNP